MAVWEKFPEGSPRLDVMLALAYDAAESGAVAASFGRLAKLARVDRRTVRRAVPVLEAAGWILKSRGHGPGGTNAYLINSRKLDLMSQAFSQKMQRWNRGAGGRTCQSKEKFFTPDLIQHDLNRAGLPHEEPASVTAPGARHEQKQQGGGNEPRGGKDSASDHGRILPESGSAHFGTTSRVGGSLTFHGSLTVIPPLIWNDPEFQALWGSRWECAVRANFKTEPEVRVCRNGVKCDCSEHRALRAFQVRRSYTTLFRLRHRGTVLKRFGNRCAWCRSRGVLTLKHVLPVTWGGTNDLFNLAPACVTCSPRRGNKLPEAPCATTA